MVRPPPAASQAARVLKGRRMASLVRLPRAPAPALPVRSIQLKVAAGPNNPAGLPRVICMPSLTMRKPAKTPSLGKPPARQIRRAEPAALRLPLPTVRRTPGPPALAPAVSRYRFDKIIGDGGTSTVYKAEDLLLGMPVAIKVLKRELSDDAAAVARLKVEARIAMQLAHSHIVRLHDLQKVGGHYMLVMEYVDGYSLRHVLDEYGRLALESVLDIVALCADALSYAHRKGMLHNDLKPDNLLLTTEGVLKVVDFGTASFANSSPESEYIIGTPVYMSPEQLRGEQLDVRTDVYALGMTVYELLTGRTPYSPQATLEDIRALKREPLTGVPDAIREVLDKAIAPDRDARWPSVEEFRNALFLAAGRPAPAS